MTTTRPTHGNTETQPMPPTPLEPARAKPSRPGQVPSNEEPELGFERDLPTQDDSNG